MSQDFEASFTTDIVTELQKALIDPDIDPEQHIQDHTKTIGFKSDGTTEITMTLGELPTNSIQFRMRHQATASLWYRNPETNQHEEQVVSPEQQKIIDTYATAVALRILGIAKGEVLDEYNIVANASILAVDEIMTAITERVYEATALTKELVHRVHTNEPGQTDRTLMDAEALAHILAGTKNVATYLQEDIWTEIIAYGNTGDKRWDALDA